MFSWLLGFETSELMKSDRHLDVLQSHLVSIIESLLLLSVCIFCQRQTFVFFNFIFTFYVISCGIPTFNWSDHYMFVTTYTLLNTHYYITFITINSEITLKPLILISAILMPKDMWGIYFPVGIHSLEDSRVSPILGNDPGQVTW